MIILDIDKPTNCRECEIKGSCKYTRIFKDSDDIYCEDCPIKCDIEDIKTEISNKERYVDFMNNYADGYNSGLYDVLNIIDKHMKGEADVN